MTGKELQAILAGRCVKRVRESLEEKELDGVDAIREPTCRAGWRPIMEESTTIGKLSQE